MAVWVRATGATIGLEWMIAFCFAEQEHAEQFRDRFAGEIGCLIDPGLSAN